MCPCPTCDNDEYGTALSERLVVAGHDYIDRSAFSCERIVYAGAPTSRLTIEPACCVVQAGNLLMLRPIERPSADAWQKATGTRRDGPDYVVDDLRLDDEIDTEHGVMTVVDFIDGPDDKVRCQVGRFRPESTSQNGILRRTDHEVFLYDEAPPQGVPSP